MKRRVVLNFCLLVSLSTIGAIAEPHPGVMIQGFYWDVPSPAAGNPSAPWWWDRLAAEALSLSANGFTAIWIPPVMKGASGGYSVGYDPYDDYDLGSKLQRGTLPLRYGLREQLERTIAIYRANGMNVYVDLVENHRSGDPGDYNFRYLDAWGHPGGGRFPKGPGDFHPNVPQDPGVPVGATENFGQFGRDLAPVNGKGTGEKLKQGGDWLTRSLDIQGYRLDYVRGISTDWLYDFLNTGAMKGKFAVGEYYDANLALASNWVSVGLKGRCAAFDFPLRELLKQMCNDPAHFDMTRLDHAGLAGVDPDHAVTFAENHDTDRSDPIYTNKALAYAYILTSEGYPCVFYRDYSTDKGCYHMEAHIDKLIRIHTLARGATKLRWKDHDTLVYERTGEKGVPPLLVGLNESAKPRNLTTATGFRPRVLLHDYADHAPDVRVGPAGMVTITIPPNVDGSGYVCYSPAGQIRRPAPPAFSVTQNYEGANDLDIKPADNRAPVQVCRIWPAAGKSIRAVLSCDTTGWSSKTRARLQLEAPDGVKIASFVYKKQNSLGSSLKAMPQATGWYTFRVRSFDTPAANPMPSYRLRVTYTAPQELNLVPTPAHMESPPPK